MQSFSFVEGNVSIWDYDVEWLFQSLFGDDYYNFEGYLVFVSQNYYYEVVLLVQENYVNKNYKLVLLVCWFS